MRIHDTQYQTYVQILKEELQVAYGCTEPIAIAYAAACARDTLGKMPQRVVVEVSGNILKNAKSVTVPNTCGLCGIEAAVAAGILYGDASKELEVISAARPQNQEELLQFIDDKKISVRLAESDYVFDIVVYLYADSESSKVRIVGRHTNIVEIEKNGETLKSIPIEENSDAGLTDRSVLNVAEIIQFADILETADIAEIVGRQITYNMAIAEEGLRGDYGANIGSVLLATHNKDELIIKARAYAAAGSDARMSGSPLPVVICSGSGNQGITASVPVIVYAREKKIAKDKLLRALVVSNLITIHLKTGIGRLSAYCGAVSAGCGCGAGIAYLLGGDYDVISHTIVNAIAIDSGIICDGAKASCAAKIASAVDAGILGYQMYQNGQQFKGGEGIIKKGVEKNIVNVGLLAKDGMKKTDEEILYIMTEC